MTLTIIAASQSQTFVKLKSSYLYRFFIGTVGKVDRCADNTMITQV